MTDSVNIFIAFAGQDKFARDRLIEEAKQLGSPRCVFVETTRDDPLNPVWRANCRSSIKGCDGVIAFISSHTPESPEACWAIRCAREEGVAIRGFWVHHDETHGKPIELGDTPVVYWSWDNVSNFIHALRSHPHVEQSARTMDAA